MPRDLSFPKAINAPINSIIHDADRRNVIKNRRATLPAYLEMSEAEIYARTREVPIAGWSFEQLRRLMVLFCAEDAPDLAGRVLRLMFPGLDVVYRAELTGEGEPSRNVMADEGKLVTGIGETVELIAAALEDNSISPSELDQIAVSLNRCQQNLNALRADVELHVDRKG